MCAGAFENGVEILKLGACMISVCENLFSQLLNSAFFVSLQSEEYLDVITVLWCPLFSSSSTNFIWSLSNLASKASIRWRIFMKQPQLALTSFIIHISPVNLFKKGKRIFTFLPRRGIAAPLLNVTDSFINNPFMKRSKFQRKIGVI